MWAFEASAAVRSTPLVVAAGRRRRHRLLRRRPRAGVRGGRQDRRAEVEDQGRGSPRRHHHRRRVVRQRPRVRAGGVDGGSLGRDPDLSVLHLPRQRPGARRGHRASRSGRPTRFRKRRSRPAAARRGTQLFGPSGAGVWGAPALDAARNRVYIATGDSYSQPAARVERRDHGAGDGHRPDRVGAPDARGRRLDDGVLRSRHGGQGELSGEGRSRLRLRRGARARHARRRAPSGRGRAEVGHAARRQRRERRAGVEHARRRGRHSRRHRVGLRHRRPFGVRLAVERVREEARRGGRSGEREPRRWQAALDRAAERRHLRDPHRAATPGSPPR